MVSIKINKSVFFSKVRISPSELTEAISSETIKCELFLLQCIVFYLFLKFIFVKLLSHMKEKPVSYVICNLLLIQNYH